MEHEPRNPHNVLKAGPINRNQNLETPSRHSDEYFC